ncbi:ATP-binding cassette domain-containing protein [Rhodothermus sp. AH-315-K08]|nr:ATP-binding cassette domain-containing protein [Rhodothermus sp. AH-315-K08]
MSTDRSLVLDAIFYSIPQLTILQGAYVKVLAGQICGLIGRNGCGKTTLIKVAAGQLSANSGITIVNGDRMVGKRRGQRFEHIAYLPQDSMLPVDIQVGGLLKRCGQAHLTDLDFFRPLLHAEVRELSGGERRYLEVMIVLGLNRPYILLDEPFTGIEPRITEMITGELKEASRKGAGILLSDHYLHYLLPIIDDAYLMQSKQCVHLQGDFRQELKRLGYVRG